MLGPGEMAAVDKAVHAAQIVMYVSSMPLSSLMLIIGYHIAWRRCSDYHRTMKDGQDIAQIASLIVDPARANILTALMGGKALTATELFQEAGITLQPKSSQLKKLGDGHLLALRKQGRHRY